MYCRDSLLSACTGRYWEQLPEVKEKEREEKRRSQAATNRLRVQLYQKVAFPDLSVACHVVTLRSLIVFRRCWPD